MDDAAESCPSCRARVAHDQRYCLSCGGRVAAPAVDWRDPRKLGAPPSPASRLDALPRFGLPAAGIAAALMLAALGTGVILGGAAVPVTSSPAASRSVIAVTQPPPSVTPSPAPTPVPSPVPDGAGSGAGLPADVPAPDLSAASPDLAAPSGPGDAPATAASSPPDPASEPAAPDPVPEPVTGSTPEPTPEPAPAAQPTPAPDDTPPAPKGPPAKHVVVVSLTGQDFDHAFGPGSAATYLSRELPAQGVLLRSYKSVARGSLGGQVALLTGAAPTPEQEQDCPRPGAACQVPARTPSLPSELTDAARSWKAYVQGRRDPCGRPGPGSSFGSLSRDPFPYLRGLRGDCRTADVDLAKLAEDFSSTDLAPSLAYVVPDACHDGRETIVCTDAPGTTGLQRADVFLRELVPALTGSPAFADDGLLVVLFDGGGLPPRADDDDAPALGAVVVGRFAAAGKVSGHPYDHLSLLRTLAGTFAVAPPGRAAGAGIREFGRDVFPSGLRSQGVLRNHKLFSG